MRELSIRFNLYFDVSVAMTAKLPGGGFVPNFKNQLALDSLTHDVSLRANHLIGPMLSETSP